MIDRRPSVPRAIIEGRVVAIGRGLAPDDVVGVGEALVAGGIRAFEVTLNSPAALDGIRALTSRFAPDDLLVGAGTVLDLESAEAALDAGARFLVMPHMDLVLVAWSAQRDVPAFPGGFTPTEILAGWRAGAAAVKLFPASVAGPAFVREFRGPFPDVPLLPTGGIDPASASEFLRAGAVAVGLGGWLTGSGDLATIRARATEIVAAVVPA